IVWQLWLVMENRARVFEFPVFMALVFAVFAVPQIVSLIRHPGEATGEAVEAVVLMTLLCLGACILGYRLPASSQIVQRASFGLDLDRLFHGGLVFTACGYFFGYLINQMS